MAKAGLALTRINLQQESTRSPRLVIAVQQAHARLEWRE
jgi:hypothetical protein